MCRSPWNRRHRTKPGQGGPSPVRGWRGITGQRAGAVTDAPRASSAVWPRPLRRSPPEQAQATGKWRNNIRRGGSGARQSEQRKTGGSHRPLPGTTNCPKRRCRDRGCGCTPGDGRDGCAAGNRAARSRGVPAPIPGSGTIISNPSEARRLQSAGGSNRTRGRVLILPLCFWRISRSGGRES